LTGPVLNPDGVSVKGCSIIYASEGQAGEYAPLAAKAHYIKRDLQPYLPKGYFNPLSVQQHL
jgi:hypothetical protein